MMLDKYNDLIWQALRPKKSPQLELAREEALEQFQPFIEAVTLNATTDKEREFIQEESMVALMREVWVKSYITCMIANNLLPPQL
jgi:hypothetical protein